MDRVKIGFLGSTAPSSPHLDSFRPCVPQDVEFTFVQEADAGDSLWDVQGKTEGLIRQANELIERHGWDGLVISGGPKEVLNPGMWERLGVEIKVPVATALRPSFARSGPQSDPLGNEESPDPLPDAMGHGLWRRAVGTIKEGPDSGSFVDASEQVAVAACR